MLQQLRHWVERIWRKWLSRRSQKAHRPWQWMERLLERYPLPAARVVHSALLRAASP